MPRAWVGAVTAALFAATTMGPAAAQAPAPSPAPVPAIEGPVFIVTYFEVDAPAAAKTARMLRAFAAATRQEKGNGGFLAVRETGRSGRFATLEMWRDTAAADAHRAAVDALGDKLKPVFVAPFDIRLWLRRRSGLLARRQENRLHVAPRRLSCGQALARREETSRI